MGWLEVLKDAALSFLFVAVLPCFVAWAVAIGWHMGRRDAAMWFGPNTTTHEINMSQAKEPR